MARCLTLAGLALFVVIAGALENATTEISDSVSLNETKLPLSLDRHLDFFSPELLSKNWDFTRDNVSDKCAQDVDAYIKGLEKLEIWALKMDDASGRYSNGWYWGNLYWMGSQSLCENIAPKNEAGETVKIEHVRKERDAALRKDMGLPIKLQGYNPSANQYKSIPPFAVNFFMMRLHLNFTIPHDERVVHVGLCLPATCQEEDVHTIVENSSKNLPTLNVTVEAVRSREHTFSLWKDRTFLILCLVSFGVGALLVAGTFYDIHLNKCEAQRKMSNFNDVKVDITIPDKPKNGKCSVYTVTSADISTETQRQQNFTDLSIGQLLKDLLLSFSVKVNMKNICDKSVGSDTLPVVHGLKSISMLWVILGHTCIVAFKYSDNMEYRRVIQKHFFFQTILSGGLAVDTFFFTSGLLVSYLYFRTNAKGKLEKLTEGFKGCTSGILHFCGLLVYRFARLTAPYLFVLGVVEVTMKWLKYNSVFEPPTDDDINCPTYWWRNILYINTLFPVEQMCMLWSWYLSDDTQFYFVGAIILILATRHLKSATALLAAILLSSWLTTGWIAFSNSHLPQTDDPLALFDKIYDKPWTRMGPYLIGMLTGWLLFKTDSQVKMSKLVVAVGWLASASCLLSLVYGLYEADLTPFAGAAYSSLSHSAWALGLAWIVVACSTGYGGAANYILAHPVLYPFSRVTYCAYLIHPVVIRIVAMSLDHPLHLAKELVAVVFLGQTVASYALAFLISVAFEAPVVSMLRILTKLTPHHKKSQT